ncbi:DHH family phosphoesterase [Halalkaliarchaeum desulfuricum]|uniref:DHH family phosphoesterase n=1 Tax=Halalkaliarchaeum desulfuricum TaxID=2055893 RepID=A0A343TKX8_9EURY|nr:DHH family phosphoesterase [Halalkaliarchaeum desulfuricum]AUX09750.1 DHH family phosphoesterase [Halalkaliarchaeum desulfuricum]
MIRRLVLGCGAVAHTVIENVPKGRDALYVVTADSGWASTLREEKILAREGDPTDPSTFPDDVDLVIVASDQSKRNVAAADAARGAFPDAEILASVGFDPAPETVKRLEQAADQLIDPTEAVAGRVLEASGGEGGQLMADLHTTLRELSGPLGVFAHDNPDPDAIASAIGLARLAEEIGVQAEACYFGEIAHQENRALVNLLDLPIRQIEEFDPSTYDGIALVDHSRPGVNDSLPPEIAVDLIVDHHPMREPIRAPYTDIRSGVGSTSTLLAEYFNRLGIDPGETLATALLYGIRIDTRDFTREVSALDFEAAAYLVDNADVAALERIESPGVSGETMETVARAIQNRDVRDSVLSSCVGEIGNRDALSQAADALLNMNGITVTFVYGFADGVAYGSARARGADLDLGEVLRDAFAEVGSAGGHADMAGVQVPLGILGTTAEEDVTELTEVVREVIADRFFEAVEDARQVPTLDFDTDVTFPED